VIRSNRNLLLILASLSLVRSLFTSLTLLESSTDQEGLTQLAPNVLTGWSPLGLRLAGPEWCSAYTLTDGLLESWGGETCRCDPAERGSGRGVGGFTSI